MTVNEQDLQYRICFHVCSFAKQKPLCAVLQQLPSQAVFIDFTRCDRVLVGDM
jgi:hypothetical protein